tara:strand:- start:21676 stop:22050 length:375 start_codon:yes stop_codon:yes gene_type:complete
MKNTKIKTWETFNESSRTQEEINKFHEEHPEIKERNKDNNALIFNVENDTISDNIVYLIEDPSNMESSNKSISSLMLVANFSNNIHSAISYVPKSISSGLTPGRNVINDNELIKIILDRKTLIS